MVAMLNFTAVFMTILLGVFKNLLRSDICFPQRLQNIRGCDKYIYLVLYSGTRDKPLQPRDLVYASGLQEMWTQKMCVSPEEISLKPGKKTWEMFYMLL